MLTLDYASSFLYPSCPAKISQHKFILNAHHSHVLAYIAGARQIILNILRQEINLSFICCNQHGYMLKLVLIQVTSKKYNYYNMALVMKYFNILPDIDTNGEEHMQYRNCKTNFTHLFLLASFSCHSFHLLQQYNLTLILHIESAAPN